jgi:hypothetical protein
MTNPFRGLLPFEEKDSGLFFGRDQEIRDVAARLDQRRLLAVTGTSGSGKSSLVRAGVIPMLKAGLVPRLGTTVRVAIMKPRGGPLAELQRALSQALGRNVDAETLRRTTYGLVDAAKPLGPEESLLLLVDQFEEIFQYRKEHLAEDAGAQTDRFVALLLRAAEQTDVPIHVVLTMRSDYLGACAVFRGLPEALNDGHYLVPRMTRGQLQEAIEGPIELAGAHIAHPLVQRLLNDAGDGPDQLPVLQHVLMRLWEVSSDQRGLGEPIDLPHYDDPSVGGVAKALNLDADRAFSALRGNREKEEIVRRVFQRLVEPSGEDEDSRTPTSLSVLAAVCDAKEEAIQDAIAPFCDRGFLVLSPEPGIIVDISHESLVRLWDRLRGWVKAEADSASIYMRLADWVKEGFPLYQGLALDQALLWKDREKPNDQWAQRYRPENGRFQLVMVFLEKSREARAGALKLETRQRRTQVSLALLVPLLAVAIAALIPVALGRNPVEFVDWAAVALLGILVASGELTSRYKDAPQAALRTVPAIGYLALNGAAAVAALAILRANSLFDSSRWFQILMAGVSSTVFFRTSLFVVRAGDRDIGVGPIGFLQILLSVADRAVDRERAAARSDAAARLMQGIDFDKAVRALPAYCLALMQNVRPEDQRDLSRAVRDLEKADLEPSVKALLLGQQLVNVVGADVLTAAVSSLGNEIRSLQ